MGLLVEHPCKLDEPSPLYDFANNTIGAVGSMCFPAFQFGIEILGHINNMIKKDDTEEQYKNFMKNEKSSIHIQDKKLKNF